MNPAAAAPSSACANSGPLLRKTCSLTITSRIAAAKPPPSASVNSGPASAPGGGPAARLPARPARHGQAAARARSGRGRSRSRARSDRRPRRSRPRPRARTTCGQPRRSGPATHRGRTGRCPARYPRAKKLAANPRTDAISAQKNSSSPSKRRSWSSVRKISAPAVNASATRSWICAATRTALPVCLPVRLALGDRPRKQLLDRPEEHRDRDEHHRPEHDDPAVLLAVESVGGEREEEVGENAGRADCDRQQRRRAPVFAQRRPLAPSSIARKLPGEVPAYDQLSHCLSLRVTSGRPFQSPRHSSKCRWQPEALPVSPTAPICCPTSMRSPTSNLGERFMCAYM